MGDLVEELVSTLLSWPNVTPRRMFGSDCFLVKERMFAFIMEDAVVTKLPEEARLRASVEAQAKPFQHTSGPFGEWIQLPLEVAQSGEVLLSWVRQGYEYVQKTPPRSAFRRGKR